MKIETICLVLLCSAMPIAGCGDNLESGEKGVPEHTETLCSDGKDNDGDGAVDCEDAECASHCPDDDTGTGADEGGALSDWPDGKTPGEIGGLIAENYLEKPLGSSAIYYAQACTWYGALSFASLAEDRELLDLLVARFDPIFTEEGEALIPSEAHVDDRVFGIVPLEIFMHTEDERYFDIGIALADAQWESIGENGITSEARMWIDDMYMITAIQAQAYRASEDPVYKERAALTMSVYLKDLQEESGLFFHTQNSPVYWCRGNGWVAAGLTEMLMSMTEDDDHYDEIMDGYAKMMAALLEYQSEEGIWRQVIDCEDAWLETSGSAMFAFAMVSGVKNGWLDEETYGPAARRAWLELLRHLTDSGNLKDVCVGTGEAFNEVGDDPDSQLQYYLDRPRNTGDYHGQAPMLWTASALLR